MAQKKVLVLNGGLTQQQQAADQLIISDSTNPALPAIGFVLDPNTGIYNPAANTLAISTDGTLRVSVDTTEANFSVDIDMQSTNSIVNLPNPTNDNDAANKYYVDSLAAGFDPKASCRVATLVTTGGSITTTQTQTNYDGAGSNGTFTVGTGYAASDVITLSDGSTITVNTVGGGGDVATFTVTTAGTSNTVGVVLTQTSVAPPGGTGFTLTPGTANMTGTYYTLTPSNGRLTSAPSTVDGETLVDGDRILVKNQTDPDQNGIYTAGSTTTTWTRASDQDGTPANEVSGGNFTFVEAGTQAGTGWVVVWDGEVTLNTDPVNWTQFSEQGGSFAQPANQIVYGTGSNISSDADFTYVNTTGAFYVNTTDGSTSSVSVASPGYIGIIGADNTSGAGGDITIRAGANDGGSTTGALLLLTGGSATAFGGSATLQAGANSVGTAGGYVTIPHGGFSGYAGTLTIQGNPADTSNSAGRVEINGGNGATTTVGGNVIISGGTGGSTSGDGGVAIIRGGTATSGAGGAVEVTGRTGVGTNQNGGAVTITAGNATGEAIPGAVTITAGNSPSTAGGLAANVELNGGDATGSDGWGGQIRLIGGTGVAEPGGAIIINGGASDTTGGLLEFQGGSANNTTGSGGTAAFYGGNGGTVSGNGGTVTIEGGSSQGSTSGNGGSVTVQGGSATNGNGGALILTGRDGTGTNRSGGNVTVTSGTATGTGTAGVISLVAGTSPSGTDGSIRFTTDSTERLEIRGDGGWELAGDQGTAGEILTSNGSGTPPTWETAAAQAAAVTVSLTNGNAGTITVGQVVYISAASTVDLADASATATSTPTIGLVYDASIATTASGRIITHGVLTGLTGLTAGATYFLSETTGAMTTTAPSTTGTWIVPLGIALSTTTFKVNVLSPIQN